MGVPIVFHHVINQPHTPSRHFASFPTQNPRLSLLGSIVYLHLRSIMNPPFHPQSVCPSVNLPSFHLPHTETHQWGPPPFISFPSKLCPTWATHITLGHPFLYLYISPQLFIISCTNALIFSRYITLSVVTFGNLLLASCNPCHPWLEHYLSYSLARHHPYLQSTPQVTYLYPLDLFTLSCL
jgi:hypothetical protein